MLEATKTLPTETTAYSLRVYTRENAQDLTPRQKEDIIKLYINRYTDPSWNIPLDELKPEALLHELKFALSAKGGMLMTAQDGQGSIIGFRLAVGFSSVVEAGKKDEGLRKLVEWIQRSVDYDVNDASYTLDICVRKDLEGHGIGRKLVEAHIAMASAAGAPAIIGWTLDSNERMIKVYNAAGYVPIDGIRGIRIGSDYNVDSYKNEGEPAFKSAEYEPLTYRHLLLKNTLTVSPHLRK